MSFGLLDKFLQHFKQVTRAIFKNLNQNNFQTKRAGGKQRGPAHSASPRRESARGLNSRRAPLVSDTAPSETVWSYAVRRIRRRSTAPVHRPRGHSGARVRTLAWRRRVDSGLPVLRRGLGMRADGRGGLTGSVGTGGVARGGVNLRRSSSLLAALRRLSLHELRPSWPWLTPARCLVC